MAMAPNESFWLEAIDRENLSPELEGDHSVDVACIGGGYTSLVTAYLLKKREPGLNVAVIEGSYVGFGASGRNAGMVLHEPHLECVRRHGADAVRFTFAETVRSVDFIDELAKEEGFDCELERTGYLDIALYPKHHEENIEEVRAAADAGIELELWDRDQMQEAIRSERFIGALHYPRAGMLHPGKYVSGLKRAVGGRGVELYENSPVTSVRTEGASVEIRTNRGKLAAGRVVVGLNAYLPASRLRVVRHRAVSLFSFIILTEPLSDGHWERIGWRGRQGYSDKRRVHNYVRLTGERILFGGRVRYHFGVDSPAAREDRYQNLHREFLETFPSLRDVAITHRWCGPVAITWSRRPTIGREGNVWYALGYSGMGVSLATLSGRVLADLVVDNAENWSRLLYLNAKVAPLPPEPFRYLGFQGSYLGMKALDWLDRRALRARG